MRELLSPSTEFQFLANQLNDQIGHFENSSLFEQAGISRNNLKLSPEFQRAVESMNQNSLNLSTEFQRAAESINQNNLTISAELQRAAESLNQTVLLGSSDQIKLLRNGMSISSNTLEALEGLNRDSNLQKVFESLRPPLGISDILNTWQEPMGFIGEYGLDISDQYVEVALEEEKDLEIEEEPRAIITPDIDGRLLQVDFLPIKMIEKILRDPELTRNISPRDFEHFVAYLVEQLGFENVLVTPRSGDGGRDILATRNVNDVPLLFAFECKQYKPERKVQLDNLRSLLGTVSHGNTKANIGVLVTTSYFTSGCKEFILSEAQIDGKDFDDLVSWIRKASSND